MSKKGLGRGLGALIPEVDLSEQDRESITELAIEKVVPNPKQPRKSFDEAKLGELSASIREHGVVQPIVVRAKGNHYEIIAGERRWRASRLAGLTKIPALIREFSEGEVMEIALIENLQREDLNPMEEAEAYRVLLEEFHLTQDELAKRLGKSRPQISNTLRLLHLAPEVKAEVEAGRLSMGHAKVLLGVENHAKQVALARRAGGEGLSVRELENVVKHSSSPAPGRVEKGQAGGLTADLRAVENRLSEHFGTPVRLSVGEHKGKIEITFFGEEGLGRILDSLGLGVEGEVVRPSKTPFRV